GGHGRPPPMSYEIILMPRAESDLMALPVHHQNFVETQLGRLAQSPVSLSRPAVFPYPPGSQIYEFDDDSGEETWHHFAVLFRYGQDEATLYVVGIGHQEFRRGL